MVVLVTGASGQLGQALRFIAPRYGSVDLRFMDSTQGDITDPDTLRRLFETVKPDFCINAAAYTAVDKAESEPGKARAINVDGAANLAHICKVSNCTLIHVSTDFVFDGSGKTPYLENDTTAPTGVYGQTKLEGEQAIANILDRYYIVRTSWLYSQFGHNFMKTMLRLASERDEVNVVNDQIGTPTNAVDLAHALLAMVLSGKTAYGIYHFSNEGIASWYDFAKEIFGKSGKTVKLNAIPTSAFPTPARRPPYSVLDKTRIKSVFGLEIRDWKTALSDALAAIC